MNSNRDPGGLVRALEIEVRVLAEDGKPPHWLEHADEAGHWVYEIVSRAVRDSIRGVARIDRSYAEAHSFAQYLSVYAAPSIDNIHAVHSQSGELVAQIQHDLAVKFGLDRSPPVVRIDADAGFHEQPQPGAMTLVTPHVEDSSHSPQPYIVVQQPGPSEPPRPAPPAEPERPRGSAMIWLSAILGASLIGNAFLFWSNTQMQPEAKAAGVLRTTLAKTEMDLTLARTARTFEAGECTRSITEHRRMIDELAKQCRPTQPAPKPPPLPAPYPETPNPFSQPR